LAIIRFDFTRGEADQPHSGSKGWPDGSYCPMPSAYGDNGAEKRERCGALVLWEEHAGHCLYEYEYNGYDDSDFYMVVWNGEKRAPETIMFATTRGWSYPSLGSRADATPEVRAAYDAWRDEQARFARIADRAAKCREICERRKKDREVANAVGCSPLRIRVLRRVYSQEEFAAIERLLRTKKFRSEFRAKLCQQIRDWLNDPLPKYRTPLSARQIEYI
jgi:hypothetical protein